MHGDASEAVVMMFLVTGIIRLCRGECHLTRMTAPERHAGPGAPVTSLTRWLSLGLWEVNTDVCLGILGTMRVITWPPFGSFGLLG